MSAVWAIVTVPTPPSCPPPPDPTSFDGFFLRTASFDIPAEGKSAFALEMDDVRVMLRDSSDRSLALVDELGKGTSARCVLFLVVDRSAVVALVVFFLFHLFSFAWEPPYASKVPSEGRKAGWVGGACP